VTTSTVVVSGSGGTVEVAFTVVVILAGTVMFFGG
jgi:hypothetical protein